MCEIKLQKTCIINANIFDGESDTLRKGTVVINGSIIEKVVYDHVYVPDDDDKVIDADGKVLTPGMIDCHVHALLGLDVSTFTTKSDWEIGVHGAKSLEAMLMRGFTTVRDAGGLDGSFARMVDQGVIAGPRVFPSGQFIGQTCGHSDFQPPHEHDDCQCHKLLKSIKGASFVADGVDQVLHAARNNFKCGATQIKIMVSGGVASPSDPIHSVQYTPEETKAAVQAAENWGTYVMAHCYHDRGARMAIEAGVKSIEHGHLLTEDTVKLCKEKDVVIQTQWVVYWMALNFGEKAGLKATQIAKAQQLQAGLDNIGVYLKKYDIKTGFGTDLIGPTQEFQNKEFTLRQKHFSNYEILRQATSESASIVEMCGELNKYPKLGVIQEGAAADLLIHDANPLDDVSVMESYTTQLKLIMRDGQIFKNIL